jgi:hypothetical protein
LCVVEFKDNNFEKPFFKYDMERSQNDWYASFLIPELALKVDGCLKAGNDPDYRDYSESNFKELNFHIRDLSALSGIKPGSWINKLNYQQFNETVAGAAKHMLDSMKMYFRIQDRKFSYSRDSLYNQISARIGEDKFLELRAKDYNESLADIVLNRLSASKIYDAGDRLIQKADPIYMHPLSRAGRAHLFAPFKQIGNLRIGTLLFNLIAIWLMVIFLFVTLYYNILKRFIALLERLKLPILRKYGRELLQF